MAYTFQDEFGGPAGTPPDPAKWTYDLGAGGWGNNEAEIYTNLTENCFQDGNSNLVIRATRHIRMGRPSYCSARIKTLGKFQQYLGHFEARIKVNSHPGLWPAFWLMADGVGGKDWPEGGEIDILEDYGQNVIQSTVHTPAPESSTYNVAQDISGDDNFHVYRLDWTPDELSFSKDGTQYFTVTRNELANWCYASPDPLYIVLNLAVGGEAGSPAHGRYPAEYIIDYVRVWQLL